MFDFGFSELVVICIVALVVLGPTRLPGLVRKVGRWVGKARSMARDFREQLENEVNLEELSRATRQPSATPQPPAPTYQPDERAAMPSGTAMSPEAGTESLNAGTTQFSGYPYGTPTDVGMTPTSTASRSADPAVVNDGPQPGDDDYSHAHAHGAAPEPWNPEQEAQSDPASHPDAGADTDKRSA